MSSIRTRTSTACHRAGTDPSDPRRRGPTTIGILLVAALTVTAGCGGDDAESAGDDYVLDNCGDTVVEVEAVNFAYSGVPDTIDNRRVVFELTNATATGEFHEALLLRKSNDTTSSAHDTLAAGLTDPITAANTFEAIAPFTIVAISIVEPDGGDTTDVFAANLTPGDYIIACLLPVESPELLERYFAGDEVAAQRHFDEGMFAEFTVPTDS